jgi:ribonuclease HI
MENSFKTENYLLGWLIKTKLTLGIICLGKAGAARISASSVTKMKKPCLIFLSTANLRERFGTTSVLTDSLQSTWQGISIADCFVNWLSRERAHKLLPPMVIWHIWLARNSLIFENFTPSSNSVAYRALGMHQLWRDIHPTKEKKKVFINPHIADNFIKGWFDGATQHNGAMCGAGGLIRLTENSIYKWIFSCGPGTNTRAELLGAWASLHLARRLNLENFHLIGDSKVIIDWLNCSGELHSIHLFAWMDRIKILQCQFKNLIFTHTSREFNKQANILSKSALLKQSGLLSYTHWMDGHEGLTHHQNFLRLMQSTISILVDHLTVCLIHWSDFIVYPLHLSPENFCHFVQGTLTLHCIGIIQSKENDPTSLLICHREY